MVGGERDIGRGGGILQYRNLIEIAERDGTQGKGPVLWTLIQSAGWGLVLLAACLCLYDIHLEPRLLPVPIYDEEPRPFALARRTVIMVADGLRADVAFVGGGQRRLLTSLPLSQSLPPNMPFVLEQVRSGQGKCLIAKAEAPTESRPNHQALLGGFPEEIRNALPAIKVLDRDFDHVLRRARYGFALGAPDVVGYFQGPHVRVKTFPMAYYRERSATELDKWSFDQLRELLADPTAEAALRSDQVVILLHFAGVDAAGHRFGALSSAYQDAAKHVDALVRETQALLERFYGRDDGTLWILTSDHGFPDRGSHGDRGRGTQECPFVVWGAPIRGETANVKLADGADLCGGGPSLAQIQIPAFISGALGIPFPGNNLGRYPEGLVDPSRWREGQLWRLLGANLGQLVNEYCVQAKEFRKLSIFGRAAVSCCERERARLSKLMLDGDPDGHREMALRRGLERIGHLRWHLFLWRGLFAALPALATALGVFFAAVPAEVTEGRRRRRQLIRVRRLLASLLLAGVWVIWGYRTGISFGVSLVAAWIWWGMDLTAAGRSIGMAARLPVQLGLMLYLGLFEPRLLLLALIPLMLTLKRIQAPSTTKLCLLMAGGLSFGLPLSPTWRHVVPVLIIPMSLYEAAKLEAPESDERLLLRGAMVILGLMMKGSLLLDSGLLLAGPMRTGGLCLLAVGGAGALMAIFRVARRMGARGRIRLLLLDTMIFALGTLIVDSALLVPGALGIYTLALFGSAGGDDHCTTAATIILLCGWITAGPTGVAAAGLATTYALGPLGRVLLIPWYGQLPLAAMVSILILAVHVRVPMGGGAMGGDRKGSRSLGGWTCQLGVQSAALGCLLGVLYIPRSDSWREMVAGLGKCLLMAGQPLIVAGAALVWEVGGPRHLDEGEMMELAAAGGVDRDESANPA